MKRRPLVGCSILGLLIIIAFAVMAANVPMPWFGAGFYDKPYAPLYTVDTAAAAEAAIAKGENVNEKDPYNRTPLQRAAVFGLTDVARVLLSHGADVHAVDDAGYSPLYLAVGDYPDPDEGLKSTAYGKPKARLATARLLVQHGADVNARTNAGDTPLFAAAGISGNLEVINLLISSGANVRVIDSQNDTPLIRATFSGDIEMVRRLLSAGADPNVQNWSQETALHIAAEQNYADIVRLLLANGANPNLRDRDGKTAADRTKDPAIRAVLSGKP